MQYLGGDLGHVVEGAKSDEAMQQCWQRAHLRCICTLAQVLLRRMLCLNRKEKITPFGVNLEKPSIIPDCPGFASSLHVHALCIGPSVSFQHVTAAEQRAVHIYMSWQSYRQGLSCTVAGKKLWRLCI